MTKYYKAGKFKNIGVSNFTKVHLEELLDLSETDKELYKIRPSVVQNENHIFYCDEEALKFCNTKGIFYQSYSPFGQGKILSFLNTSNDERLKNLTQLLKDENISVTKMLLLYNLQNGIGVIPKTCNIDRLIENISFERDLSREELELLNNMKALYPEMAVKTAWDPSKIK